MIKKLTLLVAVLGMVTLANGQWTSKADLNGLGRNHPVTFTLNGKGYAATGLNRNTNVLLRDVQEYDPLTNTWTNKGSFPGGNRAFAAGASYNGKGYLGFGLSSTNYLNDLWEYNPTTNTWTQLASCPGLGRRHPSFIITSNGKIYAGQGDGENASGVQVDFADWWEYDIATDTWVQRPNLPGPPRHHPYYFALGTDAYIGFGHSGQNIYGDFYKFNSLDSSWTQLSNFPGETRVAGAQLTHNGFGYIVDGEGSDHRNLADGEFYKYDPTLDSWTKMQSHNGDGLWAPGAFVIGDMVYVTGGDDNANNSYRKLWAYSMDPMRVDSKITENRSTYTLDSKFYDQGATFQWIDCSNDSLIPGATSNSISIPFGASYALQVTYSEGGIDTSACYASTKGVGIDDLYNVSNFTIYPNPTRATATIAGLEGLENEVTISLVNQLGAAVRDFTIDGTLGTIDLNGLVGGTYFVVFKSENGQVLSTQKLHKLN